MYLLRLKFCSCENFINTQFWDSKIEFKKCAFRILELKFYNLNKIKKAFEMPIQFLAKCYANKNSSSFNANNYLKNEGFRNSDFFNLKGKSCLVT